MEKPLGDEEAGHECHPMLRKCRKSENPKEILSTLNKAASSGDLKQVLEILEKDVGNRVPITRKFDKSHMTPLHHACFPDNSKNVEICTALLEHDKRTQDGSDRALLVNEVDIWKKTALHEAATLEHIGLVNLLLSYGADPNIVDVGGFTPLHNCAQKNSSEAIECARALLTKFSLNQNPAVSLRFILRPVDVKKLKERACPLVHTAVLWKAPKMLSFLLEEGLPHAVRDSMGDTALHTAAGAVESEEALECVRILLRVSTPEEVNARGSHEETPLMVAARNCRPKILTELLTDSRTYTTAVDNTGSNVLYYAASAFNNDLSCLKILLDQIPEEKRVASLFYQRDFDEETPFDVALKTQSFEVAKYLLEFHPMGEYWWRDEQIIDEVYKYLPQLLVGVLNHSIKRGEARPGQDGNKYRTSFDFGPIVGSTYAKPVEETRLLRFLNDSKIHKTTRKSILLHPVVKLFIKKKWHKMRPLIWFSIIYQVFWILAYTALIFELFIPRCATGNQNSTMPAAADEDGHADGHNHTTLRILIALGVVAGDDSEDCTINNHAAMSIATIYYALSSLVILKEIFQMIALKKCLRKEDIYSRTRMMTHYFKSLTNVMQILILAISFTNSAIAWQDTSTVPKWQTYLAAIGIFLAWSLILREAEKIPSRGAYVAILRKVFVNCAKMLLFYLPLLLAFAMCLRILIPGKGQYRYIFSALVKVFVMMTGELDFEDAFYDKEFPVLTFDAFISQLIYLFFVLTSTIVLLNLLTGLAVDDVKRLVESSEINRIITQLEQIYALERVLVLIKEKIPGLRDILDKWFYVALGGKTHHLLESHENEYFAEEIREACRRRTEDEE